MLFTAVPIVWFAVMDYEVTKQDLYTKPHYYVIGRQDLCFSNFIFF